MSFPLYDLFFNGDDAVRTHRSAESTGDALRLICHADRVMSLFVDGIFVQSEDVLRASVDTQSAAFAQIGLKCELWHMILLERKGEMIPE